MGPRPGSRGLPDYRVRAPRPSPLPGFLLAGALVAAACGPRDEPGATEPAGPAAAADATGATGADLPAGEDPVPVGGAIPRPTRSRFEPPRYPESARARGEEGLVILELTLDREGRVTVARPLRGAADLAAAAAEAAARWEYEPTLVAGSPVPLRFAETVRFVLQEAGGQGMRLPPGAAVPGRADAQHRADAQRRADNRRRADAAPGPRAPAPRADRFPPWEIEGHAFTACPCDTPCPCRSNAPPSHPPCHATTATSIARGRYGDTDLAGTRFVTLGPESWVALYLDETLDEARRAAVLGIFRSLAPGAPQRYRAIRRAPLSITSEERPGAVFRRAVIPGVLEMETTLPRTPEGLLAGLLPGMDVWSNEIAYGETGAYRFDDPGIPAAWDHGGRQSNAKEFRLTLDHYRQGRMLIQHADGSGDWTTAQRALFSCALGGPRRRPAPLPPRPFPNPC